MKNTEDQELALKKMLEWSTSPFNTVHDLLYTLDGAAGTGKTTIVKQFLNNLKVDKRKIAVTAPTHKAKKVIQAATGFPSQTIQKLLGLRPDINLDGFNPNRPVFNPIAEDEIQYYTYVVIDESSMFNQEAFKLICELAFKYKVRIIFLMDAYQLPPIGEEISLVFKNVKNISTLTTVVRQDPNNPMASILKMLREDIKYGTDKGIARIIQLKQHISSDGEQGFECLTKEPSPSFNNTIFKDSLLNYYYSTEYKHNRNHIKFLAYTNDNVVVWSNTIRESLLKDAAKNIINVGEVLTGYTNILNFKAKTMVLENSEDYEVVGVFEGKSKDGIVGYHLSLESLIEEGTTKVFLIDHRDEENVQLFRELLLDKLAKAKQFRGGYWNTYYNFKNSHLTLVDLPIDPKKPVNTYNNLLCPKDIYYGYGFTVHKSQGSTYENCAINLENLYTNQNISERARLVYVALSRTRNMNLILVQ